MRKVLITGATGGFGKHFSQYYAHKGEMLFLHGRSLEKLQKLKDELNASAPIHLLVSDFADAQSLSKFLSELSKETFDIVINNAGFGDYSLFTESSLKKNEEMIATNVLALTQIARVTMANMRIAKKGYLLNVGSVASFFPGPYMAVYYATKAYVKSLSLALHEEGKQDNIVVSCFCPGPTKTKFHHHANINESSLMSSLFVGEPTAVVNKGLKALEKRKRLSVPGISNKFFVLSSKLLPVAIFNQIMLQVQKKRG